jgi:3-isopropylmalate/(R)-2-methylmalate dehydratase small subunit
MVRGKAIKLGSNVDTDQIIGAHHLNLPGVGAMVPFTFENEPLFTDYFKRGDIIVGEENFGCGSSREQAPAVLKANGVGAIVACSFARIFFRNAINLGILLVECPEAGSIRHLEPLEIEDGRVRNLASGIHYPVQPLSSVVRDILSDGGIVAHLRRKWAAP